METPIKEREVTSFHPKQDLALAKRLTERLRQKFGSLIKAIVLSQPNVDGFHHPDHKGPLSLTIILDDTTKELTQGAIDHYIEAATAIVHKISHRFKIKNMRFSEYWSGIQTLNPEYTNLLRNGIVIHDHGIVQPMQLLLQTGRIKPTYEAMNVYFMRTQTTMKNARDHMLQACVDLYWATIDAAHALLMHYNYLPPSPAAVGQIMRADLVPKGIVTKADAQVMQEMYELYKKIIHKQVTHVDGHSFDVYTKRVQLFIKRMKKQIASTS